MIERTEVKKTALDAFWVYVAGGLIGSIFEILVVLITQGVLEDRSGTIITHVNPVYGIGAVLIYLVLYGIKNPWVLYGLSVLLCGITEYVFNFLEEILLHTNSWNYTDFRTSIGGRTNLSYMLAFGLLALVVSRWILPPLLTWLHKIPEDTLQNITHVVAVLVLFDLLFSCLTVLRYSQRARGIMPDSGAIRWFDGVFNDKFMRRHYPNMKLPN